MANPGPSSSQTPQAISQLTTDPVYTFANLPTGLYKGQLAYSTDQGLAVWTGSTWVQAGSQSSNLNQINAPDGTSAITVANGTYTFGNATDNPNFVFAGSGQFTINGNTFPQVMLQGGVPFVISSSFTSGTNGAITAATTMPFTIGNSYSYFPANCVTSNNAAGWYWTNWSSATAGTAFNNVYTSGQPLYVASPTAFTSSAGSGTQTGLGVTGLSLVIPAGAMGANGSLELSFDYQIDSASSGKFLILNFGGTQMAQVSMTTVTSGAISGVITNKGVVNAQMSVLNFPNSSGGVTPATINTANATTLNINMQIATAASDFIIMPYYSIKLVPHL